MMRDVNNELDNSDNGELTTLTTFFDNLPPTPTQYLTTINAKRIWIKRDDLNDALIQGNKLRKLKHILLLVKRQNFGLLSFGGAYSNHIAALASAGQRFHIPTIGIIRGQELKNPAIQSHTIKEAIKNGMHMHFVSRKEYRLKERGKTVGKLLKDCPDYWVIPEGGSHALALDGAQEIVTEIVNDTNAPIPDTLFCACGTGGTLAGILQGALQQQLYSTRFVGVPVLKGADFLYDDIRALNASADALTWSLEMSGHAGGYGKTTPELLQFIDAFEAEFNIPLDPIYTGKLCYTVFHLAEQSDGQSADWLIYHSGGLQGVVKKR